MRDTDARSTTQNVGQRGDRRPPTSGIRTSGLPSAVAARPWIARASTCPGSAAWEAALKRRSPVGASRSTAPAEAVARRLSGWPPAKRDPPEAGVRSLSQDCLGAGGARGVGGVGRTDRPGRSWQDRRADAHSPHMSIAPWRRVLGKSGPAERARWCRSARVTSDAARRPGEYGWRWSWTAVAAPTDADPSADVGAAIQGTAWRLAHLGSGTGQRPGVDDRSSGTRRASSKAAIASRKSARRWCHALQRHRLHALPLVDARRRSLARLQMCPLRWTGRRDGLRPVDRYPAFGRDPCAASCPANAWRTAAERAFEQRARHQRRLIGALLVAARMRSLDVVACRRPVARSLASASGRADGHTIALRPVGGSGAGMCDLVGSPVPLVCGLAPRGRGFLKPSPVRPSAPIHSGRGGKDTGPLTSPPRSVPFAVATSTLATEGTSRRRARTIASDGSDGRRTGADGIAAVDPWSPTAHQGGRT